MQLLLLLLNVLFVRFPLWLIDATLFEAGRRSGRAIDRTVRRYAPWVVGIGALALLNHTGHVEPLVQHMRPFVSELVTLALVVVVLRYMWRKIIKKGWKR